MKLIPDASGPAVQAAAYGLRTSDGDRCRVALSLPDGMPLVNLWVASGVDDATRKDLLERIEPPRARVEGGSVVMEWTGSSSLWESKIYTLICRDDALEYYQTVRGNGRIGDCRFFGGWAADGPNGAPSWKDSAWRCPAAVFCPEPNNAGKVICSQSEIASVDVTTDENENGGHFIFTPAPLCFGIRYGDSRWLSLGLATRPGEHNFVHYRYAGNAGGFSLNLTYQGQTKVSGSFEAPHVIILFDRPDPYLLLDAYVEWLSRESSLPKSSRERHTWWTEPVFCGYGEQYALARLDPSTGRVVEPAPNKPSRWYSTQPNYVRFVSQLEERGIDPGTVIIDDKWQRSWGDPTPDPEKWPDMRGFIDSQHAAGRKVLLWLKAWDAEGVPPEECVTREGSPVAVDPSNPLYERRMRRRVREMLSDARGCLNADGFKIDFTHDTPSGAGLVRRGREWGMELLKRWVALLRDEAKAAKRDALVMTQTANPYFADVVDILRLCDIPPDQRDVVGTMSHRARIARAASRSWLIDTDNFFAVNRDEWLEYMRHQPALGVPSLYYVTRLAPTLEHIQENDYEEIRSVWSDYRDAIERTSRV